MAKKRKLSEMSETQQYMLLAAGGAAIFVGVAIAVVINFIGRITFNAKVIATADESITNYSNTIRDIGICEPPKGAVYTTEELQNCDPDSVSYSSIPGTLRANIVENLAANKALNSVPKESNSSCINSSTSKAYTYKELTELYKNAKTSEDIAAASILLRSCSALRVIPDALPAFRNEEALLSSLNKIFKESSWEPETLSPSGNAEEPEFGTNLGAITVNLSVEDASSSVTMNILNNMERSIRDFNITSATISWDQGNLKLQAIANAFYMTKTALTETNKTISGSDGSVTQIITGDETE